MNAIRETGAAFSGNTEALALDLLIVTSLNERRQARRKRLVSLGIEVFEDAIASEIRWRVTELIL